MTSYVPDFGTPTQKSYRTIGVKFATTTMNSPDFDFLKYDSVLASELLQSIHSNPYHSNSSSYRAGSFLYRLFKSPVMRISPCGESY